MITWLDHALVLAFAVVWPIVEYPRYRAFQRRVRAGVPGIKLATYSSTIFTQWLLVFVAAMVWARAGRDGSEIGLKLPDGTGALAGLAVSVALTALVSLQAYAVARRTVFSDRTRAKLAPYADLLPSTTSDLSGFLCLSATAGICEEILFRGVLVWYFSHWTGIWGAQAIALVLFAGAHLYLGPSGAARSLFAGAGVAGLYAWTGSLWASMLLHAAVDATSGWIGYSILGRPNPAPSPAAGAPATP